MIWLKLMPQIEPEQATPDNIKQEVKELTLWKAVPVGQLSIWTPKGNRKDSEYNHE